MALLILRTTLGTALICQGVICLFESHALAEIWPGPMAIISGIFLAVGFVTPIAANLVTLGAAVIALLMAPTCTPTLFDGKLSTFFAGAILVTVFLLGPGAFSIDARVFGRREIIIPHAAHRDEP